MRVQTVFYLACLTGLASGCLVATPTHHLPHGYSETYRQILQRKVSVSRPVETFGPPVYEEVQPPPLPIETVTPEEIEVLPPLPIETSDSPEPVEVDSDTA